MQPPIFWNLCFHHADFIDRVQLGKAYQTAGVLFEVLCAVNKTEKVEEVAPEVCLLGNGFQGCPLIISFWSHIWTCSVYFFSCSKWGSCNSVFLVDVSNLFSCLSSGYLPSRLLLLPKMSKKRQKFMSHITSFPWMLPVLHNPSCNLRRYGLSQPCCLVEVMDYISDMDLWGSLGWLLTYELVSLMG